MDMISNIRSTLVHCEQYFRVGSKIDHSFLIVIHAIGLQLSLLAFPIERNENGLPQEDALLTYQIAADYADKMRILQVILSPSDRKPLEQLLERSA